MKNLYNFIIEHIKAPKTTKAFTIIKPGFLDYTDEIYDYIKKEGFEMYDHTNKMKMSEAQVKELYKMHKDKDFYDDLVKYMQGYVEIAIWGYEESGDPIKKMDEIKEHFRDKYGKDEMKNVMHSSDSKENVMREAKIIFN